jgi:transglutaminase-like putative cysteine protease
MNARRLLLLLFFPILTGALSGDTGARERRLRYGFSLVNTTAQPVRGAELWTYAPVKKTPSQECLAMKASLPFDAAVDAAGNQVLHFRLDEIPPYGRRTVSIDALLRMAQAPAPARPGRSLRAELLRPAPFVESADPEIIRLAGTLRGKSAADTAGNIYRWVSEHIQPAPADPEERGALHALRKGRGDCTEAMDLTVALGRAAGVPSRGVAGYVCPTDATLAPADFHNWAEFLDGALWRLSDPSRKVFAARSGEYVAFKVLGTGDAFNRFRVKGDGLDVRMDGEGGS